MAALTIPTFGDVLIAKAGVTESKERIGDFDRAFSGAMRSDSRATKRTWSMSTVEYAIADARSIRDVLTGTMPITCSGDILGASTSVHARNVRLSYGDDAGALTAVVSFELVEA